MAITKECPLLQFKFSKINVDIVLSIDLAQYEIKIKYEKMWYANEFDLLGGLS